MSRISYRCQRISTAPPEVLFELVANADEWKNWAPLVSTSHFGDRGPDGDGGVGAVRLVGTGPVLVKEQTTIHRPPHRFGYGLAKDAPPLKGYASTIDFEPHRAGTLVTWAGSFDEVLPGARLVFKPVMDLMMGRFLKGLVDHADKIAGQATP